MHLRTLSTILLGLGLASTSLAQAVKPCGTSKQCEHSCVGGEYTVELDPDTSSVHFACPFAPKQETLYDVFRCGAVAPELLAKLCERDGGVPCADEESCVVRHDLSSRFEDYCARDLNGNFDAVKYRAPLAQTCAGGSA